MRARLVTLGLALIVLLGGASVAAAQDRIIVLGSDTQEGGLLRAIVLFWLPVPTGKELPRPGAESSYAGATVAEKEEIRAGRIVEEVRTFLLPTTMTPANMQAFLQAAWTARKDHLDGQPARGEHYGFAFDGASWRRR